jgi:hypothetical protein
MEIFTVIDLPTEAQFPKARAKVCRVQALYASLIGLQREPAILTCC